MTTRRICIMTIRISCQIHENNMITICSCELVVTAAETKKVPSLDGRRSTEVHREYARHLHRMCMTTYKDVHDNLHLPLLQDREILRCQSPRWAAGGKRSPAAMHIPQIHDK